MEATSTKLYNLANYSIIAIPLRRQNENSWIGEPWTATHYSFNDEMCGICILSNYICCPVNVMDIFNFPSQLRRSHSPWCFTGLWRYTEAAGYASHSHETIFATPFKTAFLEQLLLGKARHKSKCKLIHTYNNYLEYCTPPWHFLLKFPYKARKVGGHDISCVLGVSILPRNYSDVWYILFFILSQTFQTCWNYEILHR